MSVIVLSGLSVPGLVVIVESGSVGPEPGVMLVLVLDIVVVEEAISVLDPVVEEVCAVEEMVVVEEASVLEEIAVVEEVCEIKLVESVEESGLVLVESGPSVNAGDEFDVPENKRCRIIVIEYVL